MKRIWARVGMSFELSDVEYAMFIRNCRGNREQREIAETMLYDWVTHGIGELDGETYFPEQGNFGDDSTDNVEELNFLF